MQNERDCTALFIDHNVDHNGVQAEKEVSQIVDGQHNDTEKHKDSAGRPVEDGRAGLVGKFGSYPRPKESGKHTEYQVPEIRRTANGKVARRDGERGEGHNEYAGAHGGLEPIAQNVGQ